MLDDFIRIVEQRAEQLSTSNQPDIYFVSQSRQVPIMNMNRDTPQLLILPLLDSGSAPSLMKRIERLEDDDADLQSSFQAIIDNLSQFLGGNPDAEDDKIWRLRIVQKMNYAISIWGRKGLLHNGSGLFGIKSERVTGSGFLDTLYVVDNGEKISIAQSKYTRHPAPSLSDFAPIAEHSTPLLKSLVEYNKIAEQSQPRSMNAIYVHLSNRVDQFPHGFIQKVAQRCLDFGRLQNSVNAEILVLSTAEDIQSLDIELSQLESVVIQRRVLEQHVYVSADRDEFIEKFSETAAAKKWHSGFTPNSTIIEFSESTQYQNRNPAIALTSPLWLFDFASSREIKQEKININPQ